MMYDSVIAMMYAMYAQTESEEKEKEKRNPSNLKFIHKPKYKSPERHFPNFRNLKKENLNVVGSYHSGIGGKEYYKLAVYGIGSIEIPWNVRKRLVNERIEILWEWNGKDQYTIHQARRVKRTYWSPIKLLWECLKESQYVEFEEIPVQSNRV